MTRVKVALILMASAIILNLIVLVRGDESPGLPILAIVFLGAAGISLLSQRREP